MSAPNPVPAHFDLSQERWRYAGVDERAAVGAAFLALRIGDFDRFTPNVTITGEIRLERVEPEQLGDEAAGQVSGIVTERRVGGTPEAPGLTQRVEFVLDAPGGALNLVQIQVIVMARDIEGQDEGSVDYLLTLTALPDQLGDVVADFQGMVRSFRIGDPEKLAASQN